MSESDSPGPAARRDSTSRRRFAFAALAFPAVAILLDCLVAAWNGWRPIGKLQTGVPLLAAGWTAAAAGASLFGPSAKILARRAPHLALLVATGSLAALAAEGALGLVARAANKGAVPLSFHLGAPGLVQELPSHEEGRTVRYTLNSLGIRGDELPSDDAVARILCVGGSTTRCGALDDADAWPRALQDELNASAPPTVWAGNAGRSGFAAFHHLEFVRTFRPAREMDAFVFLIGINDWTMRNNGWGEVAPRFLFNELRAPFWSRSRAVAIVRRALAPRDPALNEDPAGNMYRLRAERRAEGNLVAEVPATLEADLRAYRQDVRALAEQCRSLGIPAIFATQPYLWSPTLSDAARATLWHGELPDGRFMTVGAMIESLEAYNRALLEECAALGVPCVDLSELNGREEYFLDDCHFTAAGSREVARRIALAVRERDLLGTGSGATNRRARRFAATESR